MKAVDNALATAEGALPGADSKEAGALRWLIIECHAALAKAKRTPNYPFGRLDTAHALAVFRTVERLERSSPGLLSKC